MRIIKVIAHAGTTFNDKHEQFCNHRVDLTLEAEVGEGDDWIDVQSRLRGELRDLVDGERYWIERARAVKRDQAEVLRSLAYQFSRKNEAEEWIRDHEGDTGAGMRAARAARDAAADRIAPLMARAKELGVSPEELAVAAKTTDGEQW